MLLAHPAFPAWLAIFIFSSMPLAQAGGRPSPGPGGFGTLQINQVPIQFNKNLGQGEPQTEYYSSGPGFSLSLTRAGLSLQLGTYPAKPIQMHLQGSDAGVSIEGEKPAGITNVFNGRDSQRWVANAPSFSQVRYRHVYPGVDLVFHGHLAGALEYDFILRPGADPAAIRMAFHGARSLRIDQGDLVVRTKYAELRQRKPRAYQTAGGVPKEIAAGYRIDGKQVSFDLGSYDPSLELVIDPVLSYSTFIGGAGFDNSSSIALDSSGNIYLTGETSSAGFPTRSALQPALHGYKDAFVLKLNSTGTAIIYSTFLGGGQDDSGRSIALGPAGSVYLTGVTRSSDFPVTAGSYQTTFKGPEDAFVAKLDAAGALVYSTHLGGTGSTVAAAIAVDSTGAACVAGYTSSMGFPTTSGAFQTAYKGGYNDAFVTKFSPSGASVLFSTLVGGSGSDTANAIALDSTGNIYVAGQTSSADFPVLNPVQSSNASGGDAFILKFNPGGSSLLYSTFLGGSSVDGASGLFVDAGGNAYVTGTTASQDFPTTAGALQPANTGMYDVFVAKLSPSGNALSYSTYLGGIGSEQGTGIAVDGLGQAWVTGYTNSINFPVQNGMQQSLHGSFDAFLSVLSSSGSQLIYSSYIGGSGDDRGNGLAIDGQGFAYITGISSSPDFVTTSGVVQPLMAGGYDGFVMRFMSASPNPSPVSVTPNAGSGSSQIFSFVYSDPNGFANLSLVFMTVNTSVNWPGSCSPYYDRGANALWLINDAGTAWLGPITPGVAGSAQNSQCTLSGVGSSVSGSGNNLTVNVALTFKPALGGAKNLYMNALDSGGLWSGWQQMGTWTVPSAAGNQPPTIVSVTPSSGNGSSQTFAFVYSDPNGFTDLSLVFMTVNTSVNWPGSCSTHYDRAANALWLINDAGAAWLGPITPGVAGSAQNSQCTLNGVGSSASGSGNNLTVNVALSFEAAFGGAKNVYMNALDNGGLWSGWQQVGTWTVPAGGNQPPATVSVTPSSGSGSSQTFAFVYSDPNGFTDLSMVFMTINTSTNWPGSCSAYYDQAANALWLINDTGNGWMGPVRPGGLSSVQNSQCTLSSGGSSGLGTNLTVNVALTFKAAFGGAKNIYMNALDNGGRWSYWQQKGTWTAP